MLLDQSSFFCPTRIVMGAGSTGQLRSILDGFAATRVFLAVDQALLESPFLADVLATLRAVGAVFEIFSEIEPDPHDTSVLSRP